MKHWHRCERWWRLGLDCPFKERKEHEEDEEDERQDDDDGGLPKIPVPGRTPARPKAKGFPRALDIPGTVPFQLGFPFPIPPPPEGTPMLPGFPPLPLPLPAPPPAPRPLPGQPALPDPAAPKMPIPQGTEESANNLVRQARGMVPSRWRPNNAQLSQLFGAFRARGEGPPTDQQARLAVAEYGAAQEVYASTSKRRRLREWQREQTELAEAERQRQAARREKEGSGRAKKIAVGAAAVVAGAGAAFKVHRSGGRGGFGGLSVNMAARMRKLTAPVGARKVTPRKKPAQNISGRQTRTGL